MNGDIEWLCLVAGFVGVALGTAIGARGKPIGDTTPKAQICYNGQEYSVSLADLQITDADSDRAAWLAAYRCWLRQGIRISYQVGDSLEL